MSFKKGLTSYLSKMIKLAIFDFDSTLMDGETLEILAKEIGLQEKIASITKKAMEGELDFFESLIERVKFLEGLDVSKINSICKNLPMMIGAKEIVTELKKAGMTVICFSGGFKNATIPAKDFLGLDGEFSNIFHVKNNKLTGLVGGEMMFNDSKGNVLLNLQSILKITPEETMTVGDGANDRSMFQHSATRVAFCAKEILKKEANIIVEQKDLTKILDKINL